MRLILCFLMLSQITFGQIITGKVLEDGTNNPLSGVNIYVRSTDEGTSTTGNGYFKLKTKLPLTEKDTIYFSFVGYSTKKLSISKLRTKDNIILLTQDYYNLKEIPVVSNRILKYKINFKKLASLKEGIFSFGSLLVGNKIYVVGGDESFEEDTAMEAFSDYGDDLMSFINHMRPNLSWQTFSGSLNIYDIPSNSWTKSNLKFEQRAYHTMNYFNYKIYILGGKKLSDNKQYEYLDSKIEVFDITKNTILNSNVNPHQAINFASVVYDDNLIVMGGSTKLDINGNKIYSNKNHLLNLKTGYWYELNAMPKAKETKAVLIKNNIYLIGGFCQRALNDIDVYNLTTGKWSSDRKLAFEVERPALACNENTIYIFDDGKIQTYNVETKELKLYQIDLYLKSAELFCAENKLYILGGFEKDRFTITASEKLYSIDLDEFNTTAPTEFNN